MDCLIKMRAKKVFATISIRFRESSIESKKLFSLAAMACCLIDDTAYNVNVIDDIGHIVGDECTEIGSTLILLVHTLHISSFASTNSIRGGAVFMPTV